MACWKAFRPTFLPLCFSQIMGGHGMVIHADENRLTRNIFPFSINVKEVYTLLVPNAAFNRHVAHRNQRGIIAVPRKATYA
jgi:hypothetical protein